MFIRCPNCRSEVSTRSVECPSCHGPIRQAPPDLTASVFRWSFIAFNLLMIGWLAFYAVTGRTSIRPPAIGAGEGREAFASAAPLAGQMGLGFLLALWLVGFVVLGLCAAFNLSRQPRDLRHRRESAIRILRQ